MIRKIRNPKLEIRNKHEAQKKKTRTRSPENFLHFGFRICFGFRVSNFGFAALRVSLGLIVVFGVAAVAAAGEKKQPNIVFILADDLGWTDLGCQGSKYY